MFVDQHKSSWLSKNWDRIIFVFGLLVGSVTHIAFSNYYDTCPTLVYRLVAINAVLMISVLNLMYLRSRSSSLADRVLCKKVVTLVIAALTALGSIVQSSMLLHEYTLEGGCDGDGDGKDDIYIYINQVVTLVFGFIVPISILAAIIWIAYIR
jgi:hypothetical protein